MNKGLFITFEGPDGSGKTTQIEMLKSHIEKKGYDAVLTREPGGTEISEKIRALILDKNNTEMDAMTETLLYAAARAQLVAEFIVPNLKNGRTVICDRFMDSSIVYQGYGRKLGDVVRIINEIAVRETLPDVTFLMKLDPKIGKKRIEKEELDRIELESMEYHNRVFKGYLQLAEMFPKRIISIDASQSIDEIHMIIVEQIDKLLGEGKLC